MSLAMIYSRTDSGMREAVISITQLIRCPPSVYQFVCDRPSTLQANHTM